MIPNDHLAIGSVFIQLTDLNLLRYDLSISLLENLHKKELWTECNVLAWLYFNFYVKELVVTQHFNTLYFLFAKTAVRQYLPKGFSSKPNLLCNSVDKASSAQTTA